MWSAIETSPGVYDATALANLDQIITFNRQNGVSVYYGMYSTPTFYADNTTNNPSAKDRLVQGPKYGYGEGANPTSLTALANFVEMLVRRYNLPGGAWYDANGATLGKGIQYWEPWNEPKMDELGNACALAGDRTLRFWWGTSAQMIDLVATQYTRIKSLDPSIVVTSPGMTNMTGPEGQLATFLSTVGPVTNKTGAQVIEAVSYHPYYANPPGMRWGDWSMPYYGDVVSSGTLGISVWKSWLKRNGYNFPIWLGEWGLDSTAGGSMLVAFDAAPDNFRYTWIARFLMASAAQGAKCWQPWTWTGLSCAGDYRTDTNGAQKAYNDFASKVSGKTITAATYELDGPVSLAFSDGTSWTV